MKEDEQERLLKAVLDEGADEAWQEELWLVTQQALVQKRRRKQLLRVSAGAAIACAFALLFLNNAQQQKAVPEIVVNETKATELQSESVAPLSESRPIYTRVNTVKGIAERISTATSGVSVAVVRSGPNYRLIDDELLLDLLEGDYMLITNEASGNRELVPTK